MFDAVKAAHANNVYYRNKERNNGQRIILIIIMIRLEPAPAHNLYSEVIYLSVSHPNIRFQQIIHHIMTEKQPLEEDARHCLHNTTIKTIRNDNEEPGN